MVIIYKNYSAVLSFFGCVLLVPSCMLLMYPQETYGSPAIVGLIIACSCLTIAAFIDLQQAYFQQRLAKESFLVQQAKRNINTKVYQIIGAIFFLTASFMYLPFLAEKLIFGTTIANLGTWVFRFGSCAYLYSSFSCVQDLLKTVQTEKIWHLHNTVQLIALLSFIWGALFYISGGIVGQLKIGEAALMPKLWITGSLGFALGSCIFFIMSVKENK